MFGNGEKGVDKGGLMVPYSMVGLNLDQRLGHSHPQWFRFIILRYYGIVFVIRTRSLVSLPIDSRPQSFLVFPLHSIVIAMSRITVGCFEINDGAKKKEI